MYSIDSLKDGQYFCELISQAKKLNKKLVITDYIDGSINGLGLGETEKISVVNPCCLFHALQDLEDSFHEVCEDRYDSLVEPQSHFIEGIEVIYSDDQMMEIELLTGT
jgi:hypothetical protein